MKPHFLRLSAALAASLSGFIFSLSAFATVNPNAQNSALEHTPWPADLLPMQLKVHNLCTAECQTPHWADNQIAARYDEGRERPERRRHKQRRRDKAEDKKTHKKTPPAKTTKQHPQRKNRPSQSPSGSQSHPNRSRRTGPVYNDHRTNSAGKPSKRYDDNKHRRKQHRPAPGASTTVKRHRNRPKFKIYKRKPWVYQRTPRYNTRILAPIGRNYHRRGHRVNILPARHRRLLVGGLPFFYYSGIFYQSAGSRFTVVAAPIGAHIEMLPLGFISFALGPRNYYFVNDTYYEWDAPRSNYVVVPKPVGTDQAIAKATTGRLFVYPKDDQNEQQQAKDRYECHRWAVQETSVDPTIEGLQLSETQHAHYKRAISACLEGRGYSVN